MFKKNDTPQIKSKTIEAKSKSLFGKTQMDKAIEKFTNEGWELVKQTKVRNKGDYENLVRKLEAKSFKLEIE